MGWLCCLNSWIHRRKSEFRDLLKNPSFLLWIPIPLPLLPLRTCAYSISSIYFFFFPPTTATPSVVPPIAACMSIHLSSSKGPILECLDSQCIAELLGSGHCCPHAGHLYLAWPALPPVLSSFPAEPPPRLTVAANALPANSLEVWCAGFALPMMCFKGRGVLKLKFSQGVCVSGVVLIFKSSNESYF